MQPERGGWLVFAHLPAEYFFDTGLAGEALLAVYEATGAPRYLTAATAAADWADAQDITPNWNYNAFITSFFVALHHSTKDVSWLDRAVARARLGVVPGMLVDGPDAGHWRDPHNERIAYRAIMARAQVSLAGALAAAGPDRHAEAEEMTLAAQRAVAALETQMEKAQGLTSVPAMAELYAAMASARANGADIQSLKPAIRAAVLANMLSKAGDPGTAPDSGFGEALALAHAQSVLQRNRPPSGRAPLAAPGSSVY